MTNRKAFKVLIPIAALFCCGILVLAERYGVKKEKIETVTTDKASFTAAVESETSCLILTSEETISSTYQEMMETVLNGMKIGYDIAKAEDGVSEQELEQYQTVVITFQDWEAIGEDLQTLFQWIKGGGHLMTTVSPVNSSSFGAVMQKVGIVSMGEGYPGVYGFRMLQDCMIGAKEEDVFSYAIEEEDGLQTSLSVELDENCEVWMESENGQVPLLWTKELGEGKTAILNIAIADKYQRGFLCLAYSLLDDVTIYPVINGSAFYLDDFPSPVPAGDSSYIQRDYGVDTATFYSTIWWPQVLKWEEKYGIRHTGLIIEVYSDEVEAPFERNTATSQFLTYGNMLLNYGGELGIHGYNHMPLCLEGKDENLQYGTYELWDSMEDMEASLTEVCSFSESLFKENKFQVYVPPSNIISESGREALLEACPDIKVIASTYLRDAEGIAYEQEFGVEENGVINTPRITSGCLIDDYQKIAALSELNFHFVQSHFMHPDDVLDEDRGAEEGWEAMSQSFEEYLDWIYASAPNIRNVTGSQMGTAVLQYDTISMTRERTQEGLEVSLGGFSGEASFLMRVMEGKVTGTKNCTCEQITGNLYLVQTTEPDFVIELEEEK